MGLVEIILRSSITLIWAGVALLTLCMIWFNNWEGGVGRAMISVIFTMGWILGFIGYILMIIAVFMQGV